MAEIDRREFLKIGAGGLLGLAAGGAGAAVEPAEAPRVRRRVVLGRTGLEIPDVGFGSSRLGDQVDVVQHALARGITYFDTAESYTDGQSETTLGRALAGRRNDVILATKTHCEPETTRAELMRNLEASLRRLRTDRVELYFNHAVNDPARLRNDEWYEFAARAKGIGIVAMKTLRGARLNDMRP